jgi:endo-alpha-1,4-polygalactosaminidase (GH114 family)
MRPINIIYFLLPILASSQINEGIRLDKELFICYGKIAPEAAQGYNMVILEPQHYTSSEIKTFKRYNNKVLGYFSLTEVHHTADHFSKIEPFTFGKNDNWNSSYINISNKKAQDIILESITKLNGKGLDGFFLDNLDNASQWGELKDKKIDLVRLIKEIRKKHKNALLVQNAGLFVSKELKNTTNAILVESVFTLYDFQKKAYDYRDEKSKIKMIKELDYQKRALKKPIILVEYVVDRVMKEVVEADLKDLGYSYFIANIDLQSTPKFTN